MSRWRVAPTELALAVVVTAVMCFDAGQSARPLVALPFIALAGLSLAWRMSVPLLPLVLTLGVNVAVLAAPAEEYGPQTVIIGALLAVFTAAQQLTGRRAAVAGVISAAGLYAAHVVTAEGKAADFWPFLVFAVIWGAGRLVRRATERAREAGARAAVLEREAAEAAAQERARIAREMHDVVAHAVTLMVVQAGAERLALGPGAGRTRAALEAIEDSGRAALQEMRVMLGLLGSSEEEQERRPRPGLGSVPDLVQRVRSAGLDLSWDGVLPGNVPEGLGLVAYRVVQEALTNALRHGAGQASLTLSDADARLVIFVSNRVGPGDAHGAGRGLRSMSERLEAFGGSLHAGLDGHTWTVRASLPLTAAVVA